MLPVDLYNPPHPVKEQKKVWDKVATTASNGE